MLDILFQMISLKLLGWLFTAMINHLCFLAILNVTQKQMVAILRLSLGLFQTLTISSMKPLGSNTCTAPSPVLRERLSLLAWAISISTGGSPSVGVDLLEHRG